MTSTCQSSYASHISRPLTHRLPVLGQGIGSFTNINFTNSMWNGGDCYVLCWVPRRDWTGRCRGIRFCTAGTDASLISVKDFNCKFGLKHVFVSTGNLLRALQVCHPEPGSGALRNGLQLAHHQTRGAHNWKILLGSWDGRIERLMPNIPEIGNMHVMPLLILQSSDVLCLKSSACTTNSKLEFRSAPAPLRGRLLACRLPDGLTTYVNSTVNADVCFALCLVHHPASIKACHGMRFLTTGMSACMTSSNGSTCKAGPKHASSIIGNLLVMCAAYHPTDGSNMLWNGCLLEVAVAGGLGSLGTYSWRLLREQWGGKGGCTTQ